MPESEDSEEAEARDISPVKCPCIESYMSTPSGPISRILSVFRQVLYLLVTAGASTMTNTMVPLILNTARESCTSDTPNQSVEDISGLYILDT